MEWYQIVDKARSLIDEIDAKLNREQKQTQEPECEHEWDGIDSDAQVDILQCTKCGKFKKPAKKDPPHGHSEVCKKEGCDLGMKKDKLSERLLTRGKRIGLSFEISVHDEDYVPLHGAKELADEASKWALDILMSFSSKYPFIPYNEISARLKESK